MGDSSATVRRPASGQSRTHADSQRDLALESVRSAAARLGLNERTIRRYITAGKLPGYRVGRLLRVAIADVNALPQPTAGGRG